MYIMKLYWGAQFDVKFVSRHNTNLIMWERWSSDSHVTFLA